MNDMNTDCAGLCKIPSRHSSTHVLLSICHCLLSFIAARCWSLLAHRDRKQSEGGTLHSLSHRQTSSGHVSYRLQSHLAEKTTIWWSAVTHYNDWNEDIPFNTSGLVYLLNTLTEMLYEQEPVPLPVLIC